MLHLVSICTNKKVKIKSIYQSHNFYKNKLLKSVLFADSLVTNLTMCPYHAIVIRTEFMSTIHALSQAETHFKVTDNVIDFLKTMSQQMRGKNRVICQVNSQVSQVIRPVSTACRFVLHNDKIHTV